MPACKHLTAKPKGVYTCAHPQVHGIGPDNEIPVIICQRCPYANLDPELPTPALPIGDAVASVLDSVGITKERWSEALKAVGFKGPCRCPERQQQLNELGDKLVKWWRGVSL
jgi:hypothetical protein